MLDLDEIIQGESDELKEKKAKQDREVLRLEAPGIWNINIRGNREIEFEVEFEKLMIAVAEHTNEKIDEITVFRFYALIDHIKDKNRPHIRQQKE